MTKTKTHSGHTLDLVISKGFDISSVMDKDLTLSDHFGVFFDLITTDAQTSSISIKKHYKRPNTKYRLL